MKRFLMIAIAACGLSVVAGAQAPASPAAMHARTAQGVKDGSLTKGETAVVRHSRRQLRRQVGRAKATGGTVTPAEKAGIAANAKQNSRQLARLKHNGRTQ